MSGYTQVTQEERYQIHILKRAGHTQSELAEMLGRHKATISRELKRNTGLSGYRPKQAHRLALTRRKAWRGGRFKGPHWTQIAALLRQDLSPEQAANRLADEQGIRVCHEWVYQFIYADQRDGGELHRYLRCRKKRRKRYRSYTHRGCIPNQVSIEERPAIVARRSRVGDWEGDTIIGKAHRGAVVSPDHGHVSTLVREFPLDRLPKPPRSTGHYCDLARQLSVTHDLPSCFRFPSRDDQWHHLRWVNPQQPFVRKSQVADFAAGEAELKL